MKAKIGVLLRSIVGMVMLVTVLTACGRGNAPICVLADDFGDVVKRHLVLEAAGTAGQGGAITAPGWIDAGVNVSAQRPLQINTQGSIELCPRVSRTVQLTVPANQSGWIPTDIRIERMMRWEIVSVTGGYDTNCTIQLPTGSGSSGNNNNDYGHADCTHPTTGEVRHIDFTQTAGPSTIIPTSPDYSGGQGLYAYVGLPPDADWYGDNSTGASPASGSDNEYFFQQLDRPTTPQQSMFTESDFQYEGQLFLRLKDRPNAGRMWDAATAYDNNVGSYRVNITYVKTCQGKRGQFLQASIGQSPGLSGTILDMGAYAQGTSDHEPGVFNDYAWATGKLWLRILDDDTKTDWAGFQGLHVGDSDYTPRPSEVQVLEGSNWGKYFVDVVTTRPVGSGVSNVINQIIDPIKEIFFGNPDSTNPDEYGMTKRLYLNLTRDINFIGGVKAALALSMVFVAISYILGITSVSSPELINYFIRIAIVLVLISDQSWTFFYDNLYRLFIEGMDELIWIMSGQFADSVQVEEPFSNLSQMFVASTSPDYSSITDGISVVLNGQSGVIHGAEAQNIAHWFIPQSDPTFASAMQNGGMPINMNGVDGLLYNPNTIQTTFSNNSISRDIFASLDQTLSRFFSAETNIKIAALFASFPFGWLYGILIYLGIFYFVIGVIRAVIMYALAIIMVSFMLFLAPIFLVFIVFPLLRPIFNTYIKILMAFSVQPAMMFAVLSLFNIFIVSSFYVLLYYDVCWGCVISIDFPFNKWLGVTDNFDKFCIIEGYRPWGTSASQPLQAQVNKVPVSLFPLISFLILTSTFNTFMDWIVVTITQLTAGASSVRLHSASRSVMSGALKTAGNAAKAGVEASGLRFIGEGVKNGIDAIKARKKHSDAKKKR